MKLKYDQIKQKAWTVYHEGMIGSGPEIFNSIGEIPVVYAVSQADAKNQATEPYNWNTKDEDREPTYLDLKAVRAKWADKFEYEGQLRTRRYIETDLSYKQAIQKKRNRINQYPDDALFYVQNGFVGNAILWWQKGNSGYTCQLGKAEVYTKKQILTDFVPGRSEDRIWLKSHIDENTIVTVDGQHTKAEFCI